MKVGDTVYCFDENRRKYNANREIIWREHFYEVKISDETPRSWIVVTGYILTKYSKKNTGFGKRLYTAEDVDNECWKNSHAYAVADLVRRAPIEQLKKIATIIGYNDYKGGV